ncbi:uncharacterized protein LOC135677402 isoform X5 [Musa acuminata AAA Group]|uniref:uncharacterized protein LOC135677402 isoform X5 n=1 Tax=Musa acuminata AAA Group TaxID=214697 RepID=UPI0031E35388
MLRMFIGHNTLPTRRVRLLDALPLGEVCPPTNHSHLLHRRKGRRKERKPSKSLVLPSPSSRAKEKELDEVINRTVKKINAEIQHRNQWNLQFQSCSEDPFSEKKRGHGEGIGPSNMKSNLMKKAKLEYRDSHEVKIHALQPNRLSHQSIPKQNNILPSSSDSSSRNGKPAARK